MNLVVGNHYILFDFQRLSHNKQRSEMSDHWGVTLCDFIWHEEIGQPIPVRRGTPKIGCTASTTISFTLE